MDWNFFGVISAEFKGALAGGFAAALLDQGPWPKRIGNGVGSVLIGWAAAKGILDIAGTVGIPKTEDTIILCALLTALLGLIISAGLQRTVRRLMGRVERRAEDIVDRVVDGAATPKDG